MRHLFGKMTRPNVKNTVFSISFCLFAVCQAFPTPNDRDKLMKMEQFKFTGGNLLSTEKEIKVNDILMKIKIKEIAEGVETGKFPPTMHFFRAKELIEQSTVFNILRKLPKGAALHLHDYALLNTDWLVKNATYLPNCYICFTASGGVRFRFFLRSPQKRLTGCSEWVLLEKYRRQLKNVTEFDNSLLRNLTLVTENPEEAYQSQNVVWGRFEDLFKAASSLISYALVFKTYFYEALWEFYRDNVLYIEIRALLLPVYELNGTLHDKEWSIMAYQEVARQFQHDNPDFMGAKVIFSTARKINNTAMKTTINEAMKFHQKFPETIAGFDMVGQEDAGHPLWYFKNELLVPTETGVKLPFFFHAGETDWEGTSVDENILDALLLNTSRIGHGYSINKHPTAKWISREFDVPLEVCPISNQVLMLVTDLRNHPAANLMAEGHPMVISADDPAAFGTRGLSYDFYETFMGIGGLKAELTTLKQLALNSIKYSAMSAEMKGKSIKLWLRKWDEFLDEVLNMSNRDEL
ncbi:adenosine deaminase 2-A isoform X2 [Pristis pectinata]|uniref:adenosine deaminase 2-A isoform X2 n=1 Tax=Pristis pectinata TaxID=685728 RepID=UPI00223DE2AC|nr:adenosine deaminase 2-A isoform X2 [Pristis pectinata]